MEPALFAEFAVFAVLGAMVVWLVLGARRDQPLTLWRVAASAVGVSGLVLVFTQLGRTGPVRFSVFGVMQLLWIALAFHAPIGGLSVLLQRRRGRAVERAPLWIARLSFLVLPVAFYAMVIEPDRLVFEEARLAARMPIRAPLRIGVMSDLQCSTIGDHEREACARLMAAKPDLIVVAGDLFQGSEGHFERTKGDFIALLRALTAPAGVWYVRGDVDSDPGVVTRFDEITAAAGVNVLIDEPVRITVGEQVLELYGYDRWGNNRRALEAFLRTPREPDAARVVFAHRPDPVLWLGPDTDLDLFVAGHTHGGQIVLPFFGPPFISSQVPRRVGAGGLNEVNGVPIYVTRGVGMERGAAPRVRFLCPPEVAIVTLLPPSVDG